MTIGTIIGARVSDVLKTVLRYSCGIAVLAVAIQLVSHLAVTYRTMTSSRRLDVKQNILMFESVLRDNEKTSDTRKLWHKHIKTSLMVQWHVEILAALVLLGIFVVACRLSVGSSYTAELVKSLSVGVGFGLRDLVFDALCGTLVMMQGYAKVGTVVNMDIQKTDSDTSFKHRICQVHLTHVVLIPVDTSGLQPADITYVVKRWSEFYDNLRYTMPAY